MSLRDGEYGYHDLERSALAFALEAETWPVFLEWAAQNAVTDAVRKWLESPDLKEARAMWVEHSTDPLIQTMGGLLT